MSFCKLNIVLIEHPILFLIHKNLLNPFTQNPFSHPPGNMTLDQMSSSEVIILQVSRPQITTANLPDQI